MSKNRKKKSSFYSRNNHFFTFTSIIINSAGFKNERRATLRKITPSMWKSSGYFLIYARTSYAYP